MKTLHSRFDAFLSAIVEEHKISDSRGLIDRVDIFEGCWGHVDGYRNQSFAFGTFNSF